MLIYSAHIPHSPALLPHLTKGQAKVFLKTRRAIGEIAADLYSRQPDVILLLTPQGPGRSDAFVLNFAPRYRAHFVPFGDFATEAYFTGDPLLAYRLRDGLGHLYPVRTVTQSELDAASGAAMLQLTRNKKSFSILPLIHPLAGAARLYEFGAAAREVIEASTQRVAVVSLGDLARSPKATEKDAEAAAVWDATLIKYINEKNTPSLLELEGDKIEALAVGAFRPLVILLGILRGVNYEPQVLSYQQKFGVGMMVIRFNF